MYKIFALKSTCYGYIKVYFDDKSNIECFSTKNLGVCELNFKKRLRFLTQNQQLTTKHKIPPHKAYPISMHLTDGIFKTCAYVVKINLPKFCFIESLRHIAILKNLNFCVNSARSKTWSRKTFCRTEIKKFVEKAQQCFALWHITPKFKFAVQWSWFLES